MDQKCVLNVHARYSNAPNTPCTRKPSFYITTYINYMFFNDVWDTRTTRFDVKQFAWIVRCKHVPGTTSRVNDGRVQRIDCNYVWWTKRIFNNLLSDDNKCIISVFSAFLSSGPLSSNYDIATRYIFARIWRITHWRKRSVIVFGVLLWIALHPHILYTPQWSDLQSSRLRWTRIPSLTFKYYQISYNQISNMKARSNNNMIRRNEIFPILYLITHCI